MPDPSHSGEASRPASNGRSRTRRLTTAGLLAALLASSAWISLPIGTVPITLQVFVVVLAALLLTPAWVAASLGTYLILGVAGAPVFAGGHGGPGVLFGPTGGYLFGFLGGAVLGALVRRVLLRAGAREGLAESVAGLAAIAVIYVVGWTQLMVVTGIGPLAALTLGVAPFVLLDLGKAAVAVVIASALRRARVVD
jgi:biotin transport system substrate-specific component